MALRFDPSLEPGPRSQGRRQGNTRTRDGAGRADRGPSRAQRRSGARASTRSSSRRASSSSRLGRRTVAPTADGGGQLDKLRKKNAKQRAKSQTAGGGRRARAKGGSEGGVRAERVGDIRARERAERAQRARAQYRRYVLRIVGAVLAVLAVFFGAIFVYRSDILAVKNVQVEGTSHLTGQEITQIAAVPEDATMLRLDSDGIVERLKGNAWVQDASVQRNFPDGITITITERTPGAVVKISDKKTWVVSSDGSWLSAATKDDWDNEMRIVDVSTALIAPVSGSDCNDGGIKNALAILQVISPDLKEQISDISAESSVKTALNLKNGVTVAFGDSGDAEMKEAEIWALLEQHEGKVSYINVRTPSAPSFRSLEK